MAVNPSPKKFKVAIADDHRLIAESLSHLINDTPDFEVIIIANNGQVLIDNLSGTKTMPDIAILDINMPEMNGLEAALEIRKRFPKIKLVFISMYWELAIQEMLKMVSVDGFIPKLAEASLFVGTLQRIM